MWTERVEEELLEEVLDAVSEASAALADGWRRVPGGTRRRRDIVAV